MSNSRDLGPDGKPVMSPLEETIKTRDSIYGGFINNAIVSQRISEIMRLYSPTKWNSLPDDQRAALEIIAQKIARIVTGNDPMYEDNWHDIAGYAKLCEDRIKFLKTGGGTEAKSQASALQ